MTTSGDGALTRLLSGLLRDTTGDAKRLDPETAAAHKLAGTIFASLEKTRRPTDDERSLLTTHALLWARLGLAPRALALLARWSGRPLVERTRAGAIAADEPDLHWDSVQGFLYLSGRGPFSLDRRPVLRSVLAAVLASPDFALPIGQLFHAVWSLPYHPAQHETKCHVTLHRLRAWLAELGAGPATVITVQDGVVAIAAWMDVRVVEWAS